MKDRAPGGRAALHPQVGNAGLAVAALLAVLGAGATITAALPEHALSWLFIGAYAAPAAVAFAIYWWIAQRG